MLAAAGGLVAISIMMIYASGNPYDATTSLGGITNIWQKQAIYAAGGFNRFHLYQLIQL
jgi:cell division protein FtsW (lipid II flippase)